MLALAIREFLVNMARIGWTSPLRTIAIINLLLLLLLHIGGAIMILGHCSISLMRLGASLIARPKPVERRLRLK